MAAGRGFVDLVLELAAGRLEGGDQIAHFHDVDGFVIGIAVNEEWLFELGGVGDGRAAAVFLVVFGRGLAGAFGDVGSPGTELEFAL